MASCQSLVKIDDKVFGDPLEIELMGFTDWKISDLDDHERDQNLVGKVVRKNNQNKDENNIDVDNKISNMLQERKSSQRQSLARNSQS